MPALAAPGRRWPSRVAFALACALSTLPFAVMLGVLVADRPAIASYGDRAVTALETRDFLHGRQLVGAYSRYGWHHPGPVFFLPLAAADAAFGGAHWALDAGMLIAGMAAAVALVVVVARTAGRWTGLATAGILALYVRAVGPAIFRDPWNPWGTLVPVALLTALGGVAGTGSVPALVWSAVLASVVIQTHLAAAPVAAGLLVAAAILNRRARTRDGDPGPTAWGRPATTVPIVLAVALWVPPSIQEATGRDPNISDLWRFFADGHSGHSLSTAVAAVGDRLGQLPFGSPAHFLAARGPAGWRSTTGAVTVIGVYVLVSIGLVVLGERRGNRFAESLGILTLVAIGTAVVAVRTAAGPLEGYVVGWVSAIAIGPWVAACALALPAELPHRPSTRGVAAALAGTLALGGATTGAAAAATVPSAATENAPAVTQAWAGIAPRLVGRRPGPVLVQGVGQDDWPLVAGVVLELEERGWHAHVTPAWVFMFGSSRRETDREAVVITLHDPAGHPVSEVVSFPPAGRSLVGAADRLAATLGPGA